MKPLIVILGPTASGKTALAVQVATALNGEIISADSRQVYRGMNIGTGKDLDEYKANERAIPYHLIDIKAAGDDYNVYEYQQDFNIAYNAIKERGVTPILCGGTGMYIDAVLKNYAYTQVPVNEMLRKKLMGQSKAALLQQLQSIRSPHQLVDTTSTKRIIRAIEIATYLQQHPLPLQKTVSIPALLFGIAVDRDVRRKRITQRLHHRLKHGIVEEVATLLQQGISAEKLKFYGLEYKFITLYLEGEMEYNTMVERLNIAIHQFAKRQMTWFRKMEKDGHQIEWIDGSLPLAEQTQLLLQRL